VLAILFPRRKLIALKGTSVTLQCRFSGAHGRQDNTHQDLAQASQFHCIAKVERHLPAHSECETLAHSAGESLHQTCTDRFLVSGLSLQYASYKQSDGVRYCGVFLHDLHRGNAIPSVHKVPAGFLGDTVFREGGLTLPKLDYLLLRG